VAGRQVEHKYQENSDGGNEDFKLWHRNTKLDKFKATDLRKILDIYSANQRTDDHTEKWLTHLNRISNDKLTELAFLY
jgi:hypothetical protein